MADENTGILLRFKSWILGMDIWQRIGLIAILLAIVSVVANVWMAMAGETSYLREAASNDAAIAKLQSQIDAEKDVITHESAEVSDYLEKTNKVGTAIATMQTNFVGEYETDALTPMAEFIDTKDNTWLGRWVLGIDTDYSWRFCQSYDFDGETVPMLWQALTPDGSIIAYATATWNASDGLVHKIEAKPTSAGKKLLGHESSGAANLEDSNDASSDDVSGAASGTGENGEVSDAA